MVFIKSLLPVEIHRFRFLIVELKNVNLVTSHGSGRCRHHEEVQLWRISVLHLLEQDFSKFWKHIFLLIFLSSSPHLWSIPILHHPLLLDNDFCFLDGTGEINWQGVDYYDRLIDYLILQGKLYTFNDQKKQTTIFFRSIFCFRHYSLCKSLSLRSSIGTS